MATTNLTRFECDRPGCTTSEVIERGENVPEDWAMLNNILGMIFNKERHLCPDCHEQLVRWWNALEEQEGE